ncbi:hypothetical protein NEDG_01110 [Nematocida displodere]|uniref:Uncharacterized protein n=1 Tax=Nematocida displodere TaxID=1805483 RepID=A0A177EBU1_9MICR|nr:hypothetical protein NEDG_01110 [Nematocida displodere]
MIINPWTSLALATILSFEALRTVSGSVHPRHSMAAERDAFISGGRTSYTGPDEEDTAPDISEAVSVRRGFGQKLTRALQRFAKGQHPDLFGSGDSADTSEPINSSSHHQNDEYAAPLSAAFVDIPLGNPNIERGQESYYTGSTPGSCDDSQESDHEQPEASRAWRGSVEPSNPSVMWERLAMNPYNRNPAEQAMFSAVYDRLMKNADTITVMRGPSATVLFVAGHIVLVGILLLSLWATYLVGKIIVANNNRVHEYTPTPDAPTIELPPGPYPADLSSILN